jgi:hypothetical protein
MSDSTTCQSCGEPVTERFARVFGDNNDEVHACYDCESYDAITNGAASGRRATTVEIDADGTPEDTSWARNVDANY